MPSKHAGHPTIAFRPSSSWQYALIEEKTKMSGLHKKDFITRACIYSNICVVGTKENIQRIVDSIKELQLVLQDIAGQLSSSDIPLSEDGMSDFKNDFLAMCITAIEILDGAAYLFNQEPTKTYDRWKAELEIEQYRKLLGLDWQKEEG